MTNAEVFEVCVDAYVNLIKSLVESNVANKIILRCICNDNHSGDFALIINKGIQKIINLMYSKDIVEVDILERFIEHRTYGDHCFVLISKPKIWASESVNLNLFFILFVKIRVVLKLLRLHQI
jgi:hypothetical protein